MSDAPEMPVAAAGFSRGNASDDDVGGSGWFIGQFLPSSAGLRRQTDVELKWGVHPKGECRPGGMVAYGRATTVSILIRGAFRTTIVLDGEERAITLDREGDYIIFGPGLPHRWEMLADSVIVSVRFPSIDKSRSGAADPPAAPDPAA